jgi:cytoskeleton protein RodZ
MPNESIATPAELVAAREAQGLSAEDIQRQLKIHIKQLIALEAGEWDSLPGLSFVRGMLRSYGRAINVDVEPLLATIGGHGIATDLKSSASLQEPIRPVGMLGFGNGGSGNSWSWLALMAVGIAALALFFGKSGDNARVPSWLGGPSATTSASGQDVTADSAKGGAKDAASGPSSGSTSPISSSPAAAPSVPETGHKLELALITEAGRGDRLMVTLTPDRASNSGAATIGTTNTGTSTTGTTNTGTTNAGTTTTGTTNIYPPPELPLKLTFVADSWVQLSHADGQVLLMGTYRADSVSVFMTKGVVTLATLHPARIKIEFDGKAVPLDLPSGNHLLRSRLQ